MKWSKKIGRGFLTVVLGFLIVMAIVMVVFVTDTRATFMSAGWLEGEVDEIGLYTTLRDEFIDSIDENLTDNLGQAEIQKVRQAVDTAVTDDWVKENFESNIDGIYAFLKSESDNLSFSLTLPQGLKDSIKDSFTVIFTADPPQGLSPGEVADGIDAVNQQVDNLPDGIALQVQNTQELQPARDVVKIYDYAFYMLIALLFFLVVMLVFLHSTLKDAVRIIGVCSLIGGAIAWTGAFVLNRMAPDIIDGGDLPDYLTEEMLVTVVRNSTSPANIFSIVLMSVAAVLIVASFFIKRKDEGAPQLQPADNK
ncbi:hypothetical protein ACFLXA_02295 [Chloroflexota bacterium]